MISVKILSITSLTVWNSIQVMCLHLIKVNKQKGVTIPFGDDLKHSHLGGKMKWQFYCSHMLTSKTIHRSKIHFSLWTRFKVAKAIAHWPKWFIDFDKGFGSWGRVGYTIASGYNPTVCTASSTPSPSQSPHQWFLQVALQYGWWMPWIVELGWGDCNIAHGQKHHHFQIYGCCEL